MRRSAILLTGSGPAPIEGDHSPAVRSREATSSLLWEACRRHIDTAAVLSALRDSDFELAVSAAISHRVAPLLWRALEKAGCVDHSGKLTALAEVHHLEALLTLPRAISLAVSPLTAGGLEPVVLKGPAAASRYPAPGLRPMSDIDLLLPPSDHSRALRLLVEAGWIVARSSGREHHDTVLVHAALPSLALEIHHALESPADRYTGLDPTRLWEMRVPTNYTGTPAYGLPVAEELVYLCAHAGKPYHSFSRMVWIVDLVMVVGAEEETRGTFDWDQVARFARTARCTTVVATALGLARFAGLQAPDELVRLPRAAWRARALGALVRPTYPLDCSGGPPQHLRYALTDGSPRRALLLVHAARGIPADQRRQWWSGLPAKTVKVLQRT